MSLIKVSNINKKFRIAKRNAGLRAAVKSFFKKEYFYLSAVKDISFEIKKGEIVGYIGPNGAGKSTTIKMLCGILRPDSGSIIVNDLIPWKDREKYVKNIGVVFGQRSQLTWDIPAEDTFELLKDIYKIDKDKYKQTKNELCKLLNIENIIKIPVRQLSLGQRMRCEIAASLLHDPEILFLDEPTIGLDAVSKKIVRDFVKKLNEEKKVTIILTTHDMNDIEFLVNRILLIGKGQILYDGNFNQLKKKYGNIKSIKLQVAGNFNEKAKEGVLSIHNSEDGYNVIIDANIISLSSYLNELSDKYELLDVDVENESLDNIIIKLYQDFEI